MAIQLYSREDLSVRLFNAAMAIGYGTLVLKSMQLANRNFVSAYKLLERRNQIEEDAKLARLINFH